MKTTVTQLYTAIFVALLSSGLAYGAGHAPIEGGTQQAIDENQSVLNSVVRMVFLSKDSAGNLGTALCSSTIVAKNIILTARHCVDSISAGSTIELNGQDYSVVDVKGTDATHTEITRGNEKVNGITDLALVLVTAKDCAKSSLKNLPPVSVATKEVKLKQDARALVAGYGVSNPESNDAGILRAGYTKWAVNDFGVVADDGFAKTLQNLYKTQGSLYAENAIAVFRQQVGTYPQDVGKPINLGQHSMSVAGEKDAAISLEGDSGGPAFGYDENGKPYLMAITSSGIPSMSNGSLTVGATDFLGNPITSNDLTITGDKTKDDAAVQAALLKLVTTLQTKGYLDSSYAVKTSFNLLVIKPLMRITLYTALQSPENSDAFTSKLKALETERNSGNYCQ